jgi:pentatricopeptide repeat protein
LAWTLDGRICEAIAVNATIDAHSTTGHGQSAVVLLREMAQYNIKLDTQSYTAAINASSKGGQWQQAAYLLRDMLVTSVETYTAAIDARSGSHQNIQQHDQRISEWW